MSNLRGKFYDLSVNMSADIKEHKLLIQKEQPLEYYEGIPLPVLPELFTRKL